MKRLKPNTYVVILFSSLLLLVGCDRETIQTPEELFWEKTSTVHSDRISALAVNPQGHIFTGVGNEGFMRSIDSGENWEYLNNGLVEAYYIVSIAIDKNGILYTSSPRSIFRSSDNGDSWVKLDMGSHEGYYTKLTIDTDGNIYAFGTSGVIRSPDNGDTWEEMSNYPFPSCYKLSINQEGHLFAAYNTVVRSTDGGVTWDVILDSSGKWLPGSLAIAPDGTLYVMGTNNFGSIIHISTDNGDNWTLACEECVGKYQSMNSLVINSAGHVYAGSVNGIYRSTDAGSTWNQVNNGVRDKNISSIIVNNNDDIFAGTKFGSIYRTTDDGEHWNKINITGMPFHATIYGITSTLNGFLFASLGDYGICRSNDHGRTWTVVYNHLAYSLSSNSSSHVYALRGDKIIRSIDDGESWQEIEIVSPSDGITCLTIDSKDYIYVGSSRSGAFYSTDNGSTWMNLGLNDYRINAIAAVSDGSIYAGTNVRMFALYPGDDAWYAIDNPYRSSYRERADKIVYDGLENLYIITIRDLFTFGTSRNHWKKLNKPGYLYNILASADYHGLLILLTSEGPHYSTDKGDNWLSISSGLNDPYVRYLDIGHDGYLYTGENDVFRSLKPAANLYHRH